MDLPQAPLLVLSNKTARAFTFILFLNKYIFCIRHFAYSDAYALIKQELLIYNAFCTSFDFLGLF